MNPLMLLMAGATRHVSNMLTSTSITGNSPGASSIAAYALRTTGVAESKQDGGAFTQIFATTDWAIPNDAAPGAFQVRFTTLSGDTGSLNTGIHTENNWLAFSTGDFIMTLTDLVDSVPDVSVTFTVEIREGTGSPIDSAVITLTANRDSS